MAILWRLQGDWMLDVFGNDAIRCVEFELRGIVH